MTIPDAAWRQIITESHGSGRKAVLAAPFVSILSLLLLPDSRLFFCKTGMTARHHCMLHGNTQQACGFYMENGWKAA